MFIYYSELEFWTEGCFKVLVTCGDIGGLFG